MKQKCPQCELVTGKNGYCPSCKDVEMEEMGQPIETPESTQPEDEESDDFGEEGFVCRYVDCHKLCETEAGRMSHENSNKHEGDEKMITDEVVEND